VLSKTQYIEYRANSQMLDARHDRITLHVVLVFGKIVQHAVLLGNVAQ
jgi:hypothetical protein